MRGLYDEVQVMDERDYDGPTDDRLSRSRMVHESQDKQSMLALKKHRLCRMEQGMAFSGIFGWDKGGSSDLWMSLLIRL